MARGKRAVEDLVVHAIPQNTSSSSEHMRVLPVAASDESPVGALIGQVDLRAPQCQQRMAAGSEAVRHRNVAQRIPTEDDRRAPGVDSDLSASECDHHAAVVRRHEVVAASVDGGQDAGASGPRSR